MEYVEQRTCEIQEVWRLGLTCHKERGNENMGDIERRLMNGGRELQRAELEKILQEIAGATPSNCPVCGGPLSAIQWREIEILSRFGPVKISRAYGLCKNCGTYVAPADSVLAIDREGKNSPEISEQMRLLATIVPPQQAEWMSEKLYGFPIDDSRIARELERAGREALEKRDREDERALDTKGRWEVTREIAGELPDDFVMVIQADGFMTRERDEWGNTKAIREQGKKPERWHETKAGTIYLLNNRATCGATRERPVILERAYVATRANAFDFGQKLFAEAVRQGLLKARMVYFVADGGVWLWNIMEERFKGSTGTLDFYHASQHLWQVAYARFGQGPEADQWTRDQLHQLRHGGEDKVLNTLEQLASVIEKISPDKRDENQATILNQWEYFDRHRHHLGYAAKSAKGLPIGSGCAESTCKQYQRRVKMCGQFWTTRNLEGLLCLYSLHLAHKLN